MGRVRVALGLVSAAVAVALCVVLVDKYVLRAEWWQVRHTVTGEPVTPQREVGPPPGPLALSWESTTRLQHGAAGGYDGVAYQVAQGQVVTASGHGLEVRDARTGGDRWSYRRNGWTLLGWTSTRSRLVAYFERNGDRTDRVLVAFDALSGGLLWRREGERPAAVSRTTLRWPAGSDIVLTTDDGHRTLFGVSAVTGKRVWRQPLPRGCRLFEGGAHPSDGREDLAAFGLDCLEDGRPAAREEPSDGGRKEGRQERRRRSRLLAVDPAKGTVRWEERLGSKESPEVSMLDGVTLASDGTALRAFTEDGDQFGTWAGDGVCGDLMCPGVLTSGRLVVVYHPDGSDRTRMEAVDVPSGRVEWARDVPAYAALAQADGHVFALRPRLSEGLLPAGVDIVEPGDGATTTAPAPFSMDPDLPGARPWLAAAGGLLYAAVPQAAPRPDGAARLLVLRGGPAGTGPAELGGVPAAAWPDACSLLTGPDLAGARLEGYAAEPSRASAGPVRLPRPVSCTYEPPKKKPKKSKKPKDEDDPADESASPTPTPTPTPTPAPSSSRTRSGSPRPSASPMEEAGPAVRGLTVSVRWVAETGEASSRMLDALQATQSQARPRRDIGADEAYEIGPTAGMIALRVGRYVVVVEANRPPGAAARIARSVAFRLHHPPRPS
ncbi:PQQ-binding-like beta-propeller repeat protein [Spirillospora sp. NPDC047418]